MIHQVGSILLLTLAGDSFEIVMERFIEPEKKQ
jgi:hypothetical protein